MTALEQQLTMALRAWGRWFGSCSAHGTYGNR